MPTLRRKEKGNFSSFLAMHTYCRGLKEISLLLQGVVVQALSQCMESRG